ncbi:MAG: hypothetical protein EZS28_049752, partial [Streblomastix strix]
INHASAFVETGIANRFEIDPSNGSYFQRHLFDAKMQFMYVHPRLNIFNWEWIKQKEKEGKVVYNGKYINRPTLIEQLQPLDLKIRDSEHTAANLHPNNRIDISESINPQH